MYIFFQISDKSWMHTPEALVKHYIAYNAKVRTEWRLSDF